MDFNNYFTVVEGVLFWRLRGSDSFLTSRSYNLHKNRYANKQAGYRAKNGYIQVRVGKKLYSAHRVVWMMSNGDIPIGYEVYHMDRDPTNNKIENLRLATSSNNKWNSSKPSSNTSGFKGVSLHKASGRFAAYYKKKGVKMHIGYFNSAEEAHVAYCNVTSFEFGEYQCNG